MYEFLERRARDAMTKDVVTITRDTPLRQVAEIFDSHDFNALPVVEGDELVGLLTKLDLLRGFIFTTASVVPHYDEIMGERASTVMRKSPEAVAPETPLTRILQRMVDTGFKSLPVVEGTRLVGIVAREDVVRALRQASTASPPSQSP